MQSIPLIFWLALVVVGYGNGTGASVVIHPVPFGSMEDCVIAAQQFEDNNGAKYGTACFQQRVSDYELSRGAYAGWLKSYPQATK